MFKSLLNYFIILFYSFYKYIVHLFTGKCSILRIVLSSYSHGQKYIMIEENFKNSKSLRTIKFLDNLSENEVNDNILKVIRYKKVEEKFHEQFSDCLFKMTKIIYRYNSIINNVTLLKNEKVDITNKSHKDLLLSLWNNIKPYEKMDENFISRQWTEIGFQGKDPQTDFRGMGLLGLIQLLHFSEHDKDGLSNILKHSNDFNKGYPMAVASINITHMLYYLLIEDHLKLYFYSLSNVDINLETFNRLYVIVFKMFHEHWLYYNPGVMQFNVEKEKFNKILLMEINNESKIFKFI